MSTERITLTVPARAEFAKTVRMTASALVGRTGMTYDEVDDVRMAAEEAFVYACDHNPESGTVMLEFSRSGWHRGQGTARGLASHGRRGQRAACSLCDLHSAVGDRHVRDVLR